MALSRSGRLRNQLLAGWKWLLSFLKRDWELADYPVFVTRQEPDPVYRAPRFSQHLYRAYIVNWGLSGTADTPEEARADLQRKFAEASVKREGAGNPLFRPGVRVPIEFASRQKISESADLSEDFVRRVLDLEWAWVSDESSLGDFHTEQTNDHLVSRIVEVYGVDVSDIESAKLWQILNRIRRLKASFPEK